MSIRVGSPSELSVNSEKVTAFFKKEWPRPISLGDNEFYSWQFIKTPYQNHEDSCCIVINDNREILGVMGVNDRYFMLENKKHYGAELTTWIIKEEYRNKGFALKIINYLQEKYDVLIGMGISNDALPVYLRNGFHYLKAIPRFIKVLDWKQIDKYADYSHLAKKVDKYWSKQLQIKKYAIKQANESNIKRICCEFYLNNNLFSRDYEYIKWRYIEHPNYAYNVCIVYSQENTNGCFVATRVEETESGLRILHILDIFGGSHDISAAISYLVKYASERNIPIIDFFCTNSLINSFFIQNGWFSTLDDTFFQFPHLFQPIELRIPPTTSMIYWSKTNDAELLNLGKLYITKQDADFDRPILKQGE